MDKDLFDELIGSIKEAGKIKRGQKKAARSRKINVPNVRKRRMKARQSAVNPRVKSAVPSKGKASSPILDAVHEGARDLHAAGFIDKRRMREFDALCLSPIPEDSSKKIRV